MSSNSIVLRDAESGDAGAIAHLHAESWRSAYRGMLTDDYLDHHAYSERAAVWQVARARNPFFAILAEAEGRLAGFVCVFPNENPTYGSFVDNLHVVPNLIGQGIGRQLMNEAARRLLAEQTRHDFYLWVIEQNLRARGFYRKAGGQEVERATLTMADGSRVNEIRCYWPEPAVLLR